MIPGDATAKVPRCSRPARPATCSERLAPESAFVTAAGRARAHRGPAQRLPRRRARPAFSREARDTLVDVADRAGLALDNARLYAEQRALAEGLQRSLMTAPPEPDHLQVVVRYEPAAETAQVGGDWYDAFLQQDGATVMVIGDVVGHDTAAAAAMGQVRGLLRGIAVHSGGGPAAVLAGRGPGHGDPAGSTPPPPASWPASSTSRPAPRRAPPGCGGRTPVTRRRWRSTRDGRVQHARRPASRTCCSASTPTPGAPRPR